MSARIAVIQKPPVLLDRDGTIGKAIEAIDEVADAGASLLVFPEAWIPGYPTWVWRLKPGADIALSGELHARLRQNAVDIERGDLKPLRDAARRREVTVVVGLHEIDSRFSGTTLASSDLSGVARRAKVAGLGAVGLPPEAAQQRGLVGHVARTSCPAKSSGGVWLAGTCAIGRKAWRTGQRTPQPSHSS